MALDYRAKQEVIILSNSEAKYAVKMIRYRNSILTSLTKLLTLSPLEYIINNGSELLSHVTKAMPKEKLGTGKVN